MLRSERKMRMLLPRRQAAIVIASDSSYQGIRPDKSGPLLRNLLEETGFTVYQTFILPDEQTEIATVFRTLIQTAELSLFVSSGGTGLGPRDVTPEATLEVVNRVIPGMAEAMRAASCAVTPFAMTSRQVVGAAGSTLLVNLPGSPKGVQECYTVIAPVLFHVLDLLAGDTRHDVHEI
jgi:molybdopterin adenylyltransferase